MNRRLIQKYQKTTQHSVINGKVGNEGFYLHSPSFDLTFAQLDLNSDGKQARNREGNQIGEQWLHWKDTEWDRKNVF